MKCITGNYLVLSFTHHVDREIYYPAAPFPQIALPTGFGEGVGHGGAGGNHCFVRESRPLAILRTWLQLSLNQRKGKRVGTPTRGEESHLGRRALSQPGLIMQIHLEGGVDRWGFSLVFVSKEKRKLEGEPLVKDQPCIESSCIFVQ